MKVNVHEAKTQLSRLLARVAAGEEVTIARAGTPVARLVAAERQGSFPLDLERGRIQIAEDFDEPLPPHILALFTGTGKKRTKGKRGG